MKKGICILLTLTFLFGVFTGCGQKRPLEPIGENPFSAIGTDSASQDTVRVLQYNVKNCDNGEKIQEIADGIRSVSPQIVCLQELDWDAGRSDKQEILKQLSVLLEMNYLFVPAIALQGGLYGIGILSVYPLEKCERIPLTVQKGEEERVVAKAQVQINGKTVDVLNTHLTFESMESRQNQFSVLRAQTENAEQFILCGDFNVEGYAEFAALGNVQVVNSPETNYQTYLPTAEEKDLFLGLDNIVVSANTKIQSSQMVRTTVSDHNMLVADIIF